MVLGYYQTKYHAVMSFFKIEYPRAKVFINIQVKLYWMDEQQEELLETLKVLLHAIKDGDSEKYKELADENLTCFEPETQGHSVEGLPFHFFFMDNNTYHKPYHLEIVRPIIKIYDETAFAAYTLLFTKLIDGEPVVSQVNETRIFRRDEEGWKMVHFHRS